MSIIELLQEKDTVARLSCTPRWMVGDGRGGWIVFEHKYRAKNVNIILETNDESAAVEALLVGRVTARGD